MVLIQAQCYFHITSMMFARSFTILNFYQLQTILSCVCDLQKKHWDAFANWCRTKGSHHYEYSACGTALEYVDTFKDLGVILNSKLTCSFHTEVVNRANRMLGFVGRHQVDLSDVRSICTLHSSLVQSIMDYYAVI